MSAKNFIRSYRIQKSVPVHIFFWILSFYILLRVFVRGDEIETIDLLYTFLFQITIAPFAYINLWLKPEIAKPRNWIMYAMVVPIVLILGAAFNILFFNKLIDFVLPGYYFISYYNWIEIIQFFIGHFFILTLLQFSLEWFELNRVRQRVSEMEKEKVKFEMKALLTQINPHFLFNTLNNLYSMVIDKEEQSGEYILKLADVLRYVLYQSRKKEIPIADEVQLLKDYISLNELRQEDPIIKFDVAIDHEWKIAPMLFLPLIENSFKHASSSRKNIRVRLRADSKELTFSVENNRNGIKEELSIESSGIGNENIRRRLEILYPGLHKFETEEKEDTFKASVIIWKQ